MAKKNNRDKFYMVLAQTTGLTAYPYDLISIEYCDEFDWKTQSHRILGGTHYPTSRLTPGRLKKFSAFAVKQFVEKDLSQALPITEDEFKFLTNKRTDTRSQWYYENVVYKETQKAHPSTPTRVGPDESDVFLAINDVKEAGQKIPRGALFTVKKSGNLYDAVTQTELYTRFEHDEKIWAHQSVKKIDKKYLAFLKLCDDRVSVFSGQLQIVDKALKGEKVEVLIVDGTTLKRGFVTDALRAKGLLDVQIDGSTARMQLDHIYDVISPSWVKSRRIKLDRFNVDDNVHMPGVGFGSFKAALILPGESEYACVAQLVSNRPDSPKIPPCLRPYLEEIGCDPNRTAVCSLSLMCHCKFYVLNEKCHMNNHDLPADTILAENENHECYLLPQELCIGMMLYPLPDYEEIDFNEVSFLLMTKNSTVQSANEEPAPKALGETEDENIPPPWVMDATNVGIETDSNFLRREDMIEKPEDQMYAYGIVKAMMQPPEMTCRLIAAEMLVCKKQKSAYFDAVQRYLPLLGVNPERADVLPEEELWKVKVYILIEKFERSRYLVSKGSLLAWNSDGLLKAIDWQIDLGSHEFLHTTFKVEEISSKQFPFLFRILNPSQRLAVHKSGLVDRVAEGHLLTKKVLFLPEQCDREQNLFGEVGVLDRFEDGFVIVQVGGRKEKTDLGRIYDIDSVLREDESGVLRRGDSVTVVQDEERYLCGSVVGVFRLPWQEEDVIIVQHLVDDASSALVPAEILEKIPSEERNRTAAYLASTVQKCKFRILIRNWKTFSKSMDFTEGFLFAKKQHADDMFCFDLHTMFKDDFPLESYSEEVSQQQLPFLFRISDSSQRLAVHKSGFVDRVAEGHLLTKEVRFLPEQCDREQNPFGEVGVLDRFEDGFVIVQVGGRKEKTDLGRIYDIDSVLRKDNYGLFELRHGDSVTVVQAEERLYGSVVGVFRLPCQKEDVIIVQQLVGNTRGAPVPAEILLQIPEEKRNRTAAYLVSTVEKCEFFICNDVIRTYDERGNIPKGSLLVKHYDRNFFCFHSTKNFGKGFLELHMETISPQELPFLFRIEEASPRLAIHKSGLVDLVLGAQLPLEKVLFSPGGYCSERLSFGKFRDMVRLEDGYVFVQENMKTHKTTLDKILILDGEQKKALILETHEALKVGDIVECKEDKVIRTIHAFQRFPEPFETLVVMKRFENEKYASEIAICLLQGLTKVGNAAGMENESDRKHAAMMGFEYIPSSTGVPSISTEEFLALFKTGDDSRVYETKDSFSDQYAKAYQPHEDSDSNTDSHDESASDRREEEERVEKKSSVEAERGSKEESNLLGARWDSAGSPSWDDDRGAGVEAKRFRPQEGVEQGAVGRNRGDGMELPEAASKDGPGQNADSYVTELIEDFPIDSRVCFMDGSSPPKFLAGTVKWTGKLRVVYTGSLLTVVVLDERHPHGTNGCFSGKRLVTCPNGRAMLIGVDRLRKVPQVQKGDFVETLVEPKEQGQVANIESPADGKSATLTLSMSYESTSFVYKKYKVHEVRMIEERRKGAFSPWGMKILGEYRGIQGQGNSCYLDSLLFSLFAFSDVAKKKIESISKRGKWYDKTYDCLVSCVANTLRTKGFVKHQVVNDLRQLMAKVSGQEKFKDSARDISECMETLFQMMLELDPFVIIRSPHNQTGTFVVDTLLVEGVDTVTSQLCLEYAAMCMDFVISSVKDCLMIQLPRERSNSSVVIPSKSLHLQWCQGINYRSRCSRCNCPRVTHMDEGLFDKRGLLSTFLCTACAKFRPRASKYHSLLKAGNFCEGEIPELHLSAVICIESSHYNCFVRTGCVEPKWVFFDSMADQRRETTNIPKIIEVDVDDWIDEALAVDNFMTNFKTNKHEKKNSNVYQRLFQYPYMLIYHT